MGATKARADLHELLDSFPLPATTRWQVFEASDEDRQLVDGYNLLARARGPAFLVEAPSLNHRSYTRKLWDTALSESAELVSRGTRLGPIGPEHPMDDKALLDGTSSHRVSKRWIDEESRIPGLPDARSGCLEVLVLTTRRSDLTRLPAWWRGTPGLSEPRLRRPSSSPDAGHGGWCPD
jgi:hypothetical protein